MLILGNIKIIYLAFVGVFFAEGKYGYFVHQYDIRLKDLPPIIYVRSHPRR